MNNYYYNRMSCQSCVGLKSHETEMNTNSAHLITEQTDPSSRIYPETYI